MHAKSGNQSFLTNMEPYNRLSREQKELKVELEKSLKEERKAPKPIESNQMCAKAQSAFQGLSKNSQESKR